jgi:GlpG protein
VPHQFDSFQQALRAAPVTLALILMSFIGFLLIYFSAPLGWISQLTFVDFRIVAGALVFQPFNDQYWRLLSPIFLHFGWLHIIFNSLWLWELGALIEQRLGSLFLLLLVLGSGVGSNVAQYLYTGPSLFGGMSGVVYALLGFCWVYNGLLPQRGLGVPRGIVAFMIGWLVFCMVGATEMLGFGSIANAAHLGGLLLGCLFALLAGTWQRFLRG